MARVQGPARTTFVAAAASIAIFSSPYASASTTIVTSESETLTWSEPAGTITCTVTTYLSGSVGGSAVYGWARSSCNKVMVHHNLIASLGQGPHPFDVDTQKICQNTSTCVTATISVSNPGGTQQFSGEGFVRYNFQTQREVWEDIHNFY